MIHICYIDIFQIFLVYHVEMEINPSKVFKSLNVYLTFNSHSYSYDFLTDHWMFALTNLSQQSIYLTVKFTCLLLTVISQLY